MRECKRASGRARTVATPGAGVHLEAAVQADLRTANGVERLWARARAQGRPLAIAALNVGVGVGGPFVENDLQAELDLIALNVTSTVHLAKRVAQDMTSRGEGRILFTSSIAATMPAPFEAVYGASKAFVQMFAQALRNELSDHGVSVTALMPGVMPQPASAAAHRKLSASGSADR